MRKITPYNILKGIRYLKHFGPKEFMIRLRERLEPEEVPYGPWYEAYTATDEELERQRRHRWKQPAVFSVVVPVYHTPERYLREMIESVLAQTYPHWELVLVNAGPEDAAVSAVLEEYVRKDKRIRTVTLEKNLGIAGNTNEGLSRASGSFTALLDHDDLLHPSALWYMARSLDGQPDAGMIYTDEDKIREDGSEHFQPHLKPDFNLDLLRSNNYICHFLAVRSDVAGEAGGFDPAFDGAQDYDFIFRCVDVIRRRDLKIVHVPEILYHWRVHASSTADNPMSKMYAYEAGKRAIEGDLRRCSTPGEVSLKKDLGFYRVAYPVRERSLVSVIIPSMDHVDLLRRCLTSIRENTAYDRYEIIVVENNSTDPGTFRYYKEIDGQDHVRVVYWKGSGFNYSALNNYGRGFARGEYLVCLNNDIVVTDPGWMEELLGVCQRPEVGAAGVRLVYPDNTIQHAGIVIGIGGIAASMFVDMPRERSGYMHKASLMQDLSAVTAACMMVRASVWDEAGGFEEKLAVAFNDVDFCLRIREKGYLIVYDPYVELIHDESKTRGKEDTKQKVRRFQTEIEYIRTRWTDLLKSGDPYYNKNLSLSKWNYTLKDKEHMR